MRDKLPILCGMICLIVLMSMMSISAECEWNTFGNGFTPLWNKQLDYANCYGRFDVGMNNFTSSSGMTAGTQPLVNLLGTSTEHLIIPNGNFIEIYDSNLNLQSQKNIGSIVSQLDVLDFAKDGSVNDIASIVSLGGSSYALKITAYNSYTGALTDTYQYNFTTNSAVFGGLKHSGEKVIFLDGSGALTNFTIINKTDTTQFQIPSLVGSPYTQPVAWWDMNNDGKQEYMSFSGDRVIVFNEDGTTLFLKNSSTLSLSGGKYLDAHIYPTCNKNWWDFWTSCNTEWKIGILSEINKGGGIYKLQLDVYNLDGSSLWSKILIDASGSAQVLKGVFAIDDDYNGDGYADLFSASLNQHTASPSTEFYNFSVYSGKDGSVLSTKTYTTPTPRPVSTYNNFLTLADMQHNGKSDFIFINSPNLRIYDPSSDTLIYNGNIGDTPKYCVSADLNLDSYLEVICSGSTETIEFYSNATNLNAYITQLVFDPATTIVVNTPVNVYVTALDPESNQIFYYRSCFTGDTMTLTNSSTSCFYNAVGNYNLTIGVKDYFHTNLYTYSQMISVTLTGVVCGDGVCSGGESSNTCPSDCPVSPPNQTQATATGGMPLPTKIVDVNNVEQGLLPEVYYGILGFLSNTLSPMIILVFAIFFVMIMLTLAFIIKRVVHRIGDLSK
jgi:hypothetical protein